MRALIVCIALCLPGASFAADMYVCKDYVITDRPSEYTECVNNRTKERYEDEKRSSPTRKPPRPTEAPIPRTSTRTWYDGATLHKATVGQWKRGTADNRLATASDFSAAMLKGKFESMAELLVEAHSLNECIMEVAKVLKDSDAVADIAAMCAVTLGWDKR